MSDKTILLSTIQIAPDEQKKGFCTRLIKFLQDKIKESKKYDKLAIQSPSDVMIYIANKNGFREQSPRYLVWTHI